METELLKQIIFPIAIFIGQFITVYIPYYNKRREDGRPFDKNYLYTSLIGFVGLSAIAVQNSMIMGMPLDVASIVTLVFGGGLVQRDLISKVTPKKKIEYIEG